MPDIIIAIYVPVFSPEFALPNNNKINITIPIAMHIYPIIHKHNIKLSCLALYIIHFSFYQFYFILSLFRKNQSSAALSGVLLVDFVLSKMALSIFDCSLSIFF